MDRNICLISTSGRFNRQRGHRQLGIPLRNNDRNISYHGFQKLIQYVQRRGHHYAVHNRRRDRSMRLTYHRRGQFAPLSAGSLWRIFCFFRRLPLCFLVLVQRRMADESDSLRHILLSLIKGSGDQVESDRDP